MHRGSHRLILISTLFWLHTKRPWAEVTLAMPIPARACSSWRRAISHPREAAV